MTEPTDQVHRRQAKNFRDRLRSAPVALCLALVAVFVLSVPSNDAAALGDPPPLPGSDEERRQLAVDHMVEAFESYGAANGTYVVEGAGQGSSGNGWVFYEPFGAEPPPNLPVSIASVLTNEGHLDRFPPHDPLWRSPSATRGDVLAYHCQNRVAIFTPYGDGEPSESDRSWWADNGCTRHPIDDLNANYFKVSRALPSIPWPPLPRDPEDLRRLALQQMVGALESYSEANGTYLVDGAGFQGRGSGWGFYEEAGSNYPVSIATVLQAEGHFPNGVMHDPVWEDVLSIKGDVLVYRCQDRVAVFTREGVSEPSATDSAWWAHNGCTRYPIDRLSTTYFVVSRPLPSIPWPPLPRAGDEELRQLAVDEMIRALESYADEHGTYQVIGGGSRGVGTGWAFYEEAGTNYSVSSARVLTEGGHLPADALHDPLWTDVLSIAGDVLVYRCKDRVAVFTREGTGEPSAADSAWWTDNDCRRYPIDNLNATYYRVSGPLPE